MTGDARSLNRLVVARSCGSVQRTPLGGRTEDLIYRAQPCTAKPASSVALARRGGVVDREDPHLGLARRAGLGNDPAAPAAWPRHRLGDRLDDGLDDERDDGLDIRLDGGLRDGPERKMGEEGSGG